MSRDEYLRKFKWLYDNLAAIRKPLDETNKVFQLARGLGPKYKDFRMVILSKGPYPSYIQFILSLKSHEQSLQMEAEINGNQTNHDHAFYS